MTTDVTSSRLLRVLMQSPASEAPPAIDPVTMEWYRGLDAEFLGMLVDEFLAEAPRRLRALRAAYAAGDVAALTSEAHALKGSARILGAMPLADLCAALERTPGVDDGTRVYCEGLEAEAQRVREALEMVRSARAR
jgi:HPt (histidine-containing phosphotransfer) domain-containing protein